ncbi:hypothetical protein GCM10025331_27580 [Actinoplanes utahensis]|nr:hypothetical protein Aut01nite_39370 [Actinoplanes utahensis]
MCELSLTGRDGWDYMDKKMRRGCDPRRTVVKKIFQTANSRTGSVAGAGAFAFHSPVFCAKSRLR